MSTFPPPPDEWVTVGQSRLEVVAEMMRSRLEAEGIEATLRGNKASGTAGIINELNITWNNPLGGVEVRVHKKDEAKAKEILAKRDDDEEDDTEVREKRKAPPFVYILQLYLIIPVAFTVFNVVWSSTQSIIIGLIVALITAGSLLFLAGRSKK